MTFGKLKLFFVFFKNNERLFYLTELLYIQVAVQLFERFALMKALIKTRDWQLISGLGYVCVPLRPDFLITTISPVQDYSKTKKK